MASAPTKDSGGLLPAGFQSPFKRVPMQGTHDDMLACAATLCGKTMDEIKKMAVTLGMRANGPFYMDETLFRKILFNCSNLAVSDYKDFTSISALADVCLICCDYSKFDESFRHVLFHHIRGTGTTPAFSYVIDVAHWIDAKKQITTDFSALKLDPGSAWYLELTQRANPNGKGK
jgi:hypothetical protein